MTKRGGRNTAQRRQGAWQHGEEQGEMCFSWQGLWGKKNQHLAEEHTLQLGSSRLLSRTDAAVKLLAPASIQNLAVWSVAVLISMCKAGQHECATTLANYEGPAGHGHAHLPFPHDDPTLAICLRAKREFRPQDSHNSIDKPTHGCPQAWHIVCIFIYNEVHSQCQCCLQAGKGSVFPLIRKKIYNPCQPLQLF